MGPARTTRAAPGTTKGNAARGKAAARATSRGNPGRARAGARATPDQAKNATARVAARATLDQVKNAMANPAVSRASRAKSGTDRERGPTAGSPAVKPALLQAILYRGFSRHSAVCWKR